MIRRSLAVALVLLTGGCTADAPDYQAIWSTNSSSAPPTTTAEPVPFSQYLENSGVGATQVAPDKLTGLTVSMPTPPGWARRTGANIPPATEVISKDSPYPNAMLTVFTLSGDFDPAEVVKHSNVDAAQSQNFAQLDASAADFHGFPSSMIQYSYDFDGKRLHTFRRTVIATGSPPQRQRYLVQFVVTSLADQAVPESAGIESIINGFTVAAG
ncbi:LpqN/LpqT family lipoprotein [Mycobacterium sp.]|uniref:LpqN/LpqT family lipoprotein n=1 Tax=Mycobacterium sp. TaxID=1785 RepID=UPI0031CF90B1